MRQLVMLISVIGFFLVTGCAVQKSAENIHFSSDNSWMGRIRVQTHSTPVQQFSASFELLGNTEIGQLTLISPIGTTLAQASWAPGHAELRQGNLLQTFIDMNEMTTALNGSPLPLAAMFSWLRGHPLEVDGWVAQLDQLNTGRIYASRTHPEPVTEIRIILNKKDE